jgi:tRNA nucleotidyltransferase/poly(A) polymerase
MMNNQLDAIAYIAALLDRDDLVGVREALIAQLDRPRAALRLRALDDAGLLTRIIPELEPARHTDQPIVHFLPVLAHSIEAVAAVDWLLGQLSVVHSPLSAAPHDEDTVDAADKGQETTDSQNGLPVAVQAHPELRFASVYVAELRAHFMGQVDGHPRAALFKLATLLHDNAKPQTKQPKPGGGVSFHEHQSIGGEVARRVAQRLRFSPAEVEYISLIVRAHMRPGQLAAQGEVTLRAVRRFFRDTGDAGPDVLLHVLADHMATRGPAIHVLAWRAQVRWVDAMLDTIWGQEIAPAQPLVRGDDLMDALGIGPGPLVGRLLAAIGEAQAGGDITTAEEAIAMARRMMGNG